MRKPDRPTDAGSHPIAILLSHDGRHLYVALANRDEVADVELSSGNANLVRRDDNTKTAVPLVGLGRRIADVLDDVQRVLHTRARSFRDDHTVEASSLDDGREAAQSGFARLPWNLVGEGQGEARLAEKSVSVRCLQRADGSVPASRDEADLVAVVGRSY